MIVAMNGDTSNRNIIDSSKKSRCRGKQKKNKKAFKADVVEADVSVGSESNEIVTEYVPEKAEFEYGFNDEFSKIFNKFFNSLEPRTSEKKDKVKKKVNSDSDEEQEQEKDTYTNKNDKRQRRMKIAELKKLSTRPNVVEVWDVTSADPELLVFLKSYRNTVPVPRHWSHKRKYLEGKIGIEKKPFRLPDFIAATGIEEIRRDYIEKEDGKKLKQKQRERMQPKMGKMDMSYQVLRDAFLKYQTKPKMTRIGDLYFEGKEFEAKRPRGIKPGTLSRKLKQALGMQEGDSPPWLINMQRYGPPPSYKDDVSVKKQDQPNYEDGPIYKSKHWGDLADEEEEEEEVEILEVGIEGDNLEEEEEMDLEELEAGTESVDTVSNTPTEVEIPEAIELRKEKPDKPLYEVLEEKEESISLGTLLGTTHTYVIKTSTQDIKTGAERVDFMKGRKTDHVEVSLQPEELEAMDKVLPIKYEEAREEERQCNKQEDFSDMVADYNNAKKRKRQEHDQQGKKKKKDFKF